MNPILRSSYAHRSHRKMIRLLSFFERFCRGEILYKKIEAERFCVDEKSIQRDFEDLREYLLQFQPNEHISGLIYERSRQGYLFKRDTLFWLTGQDILLLLKLVLSSRCLSVEELEVIWRKLLTHCPHEERSLLEELLKREKSFYSSNTKNKELSIQIWRLEEAVFRMKPVQLEYAGRNGKFKNHLIEPQGIVFANGYFCLIGKNLGKELGGNISMFRLNLIRNFIILKERVSKQQSVRTHETIFRKEVIFLQTTPLVNIRFRYWGDSLENVFDRLPTARVVGMDEEYSLVEVEVQWQGIKGWLLAQANYVELLYPEDFRAEIKGIIAEMLQIYEK